MDFLEIFPFILSLLRDCLEQLQTNQRNYFKLTAAEDALAFLHLLIYLNKYKSGINAND